MKRLFISLTLFCFLTGCGTAPVPEGPQVLETVSPVYTDWSRLTPYEPAKEQYSYAGTYCEDGTLRPSDDYGTLLPYIGSYLENQSYMGPLCTLGLVTADGRLVTPSVYAEIVMVRSWQQPTVYAPFLLLYRGRVTARHEEEWGPWVEGSFDLTVAAPDGRWVRELPSCYGYGGVQPLSGDRLALALADGSVLILDADGNTAMSFPASALEAYLGEGFTWSWEGGPSLDWVNDVGRIWQYDENAPEGDGIACWLDPDTGAVTENPPPGYMEPVDEYQPEPTLAFPGYGYLYTLVDPVTGQVYGYGARTDSSDICDLLDGQGRIIREACALPYPVLGIGAWGCPWVWANLVACEEDGAFCYYSPDGDCVFRRTVQTISD